jgi:hypothetical protein
MHISLFQYDKSACIIIFLTSCLKIFYVSIINKFYTLETANAVSRLKHLTYFPSQGNEHVPGGGVVVAKDGATTVKLVV